MENVNVKKHGKKVKNPLKKRILRELLGDFRKYVVVSLFLILTIGFVSGMYVANESMMQAAEEGVSKYNLEDGHFELGEQADEELLTAMQSEEKAKKDLNAVMQSEEKVNKDLNAVMQSEESANKDLASVTQSEKQANEDILAVMQSEKKGDSHDLEYVPIKIYENFYRNEEEDHDNDGVSDGTIRVYARTEEINQACLMEGHFPESEDEIAIDRMHADNAGIKVGQTITVSGQTYTVVGLIAYVNYSTLHEKTTDLIFDALKFDVAMVTEEGFNRLDKTVHYTYSWKYVDEPNNEKEEKSLSDNVLNAAFMLAMLYNNEIIDYCPRYANPAINFATDDMESDEAMGGVLLDILIVIIAFIFAVTISNTIAKESRAIGTLRASGFTRGELIRHYLSMPVIVTFAAAGIGNILGYSVFKNVVVAMYYNSYSLPMYETIWNPDAFIKTTLIPVALMFVVNLVVMIRVMQHTPLQFLRGDLKKTKRGRAIRLPEWKFLSRFRLRIIFQNVPNYVILFAGIIFIMVMLAMAVGMPDTLKFYKENAAELMFAKYQYVLKSYKDEAGNVIATHNDDAEKFGMHALLRKGDAIDEEVSAYGISNDSRYVEIDGLESLMEGEVYISTPFQDKYGVKEGDTISLEERYENKRYEFKVIGSYDKCQSIAMFMPLANYRAVFDLDEEQFSGYMSDAEITDIDKKNIATTITERDITKMCDQLDHSMGAYMQYFQFLCILLSAVLIYLLIKIIIEKNENSISMTKILGYQNQEIARLYILSTTMILLVEDAFSVVLGTFIMSQAWKAIMSEYSGWFAFMIQPFGYVKMFFFVLIGYLVVMVFDFKRIKKIPMDEVLKNVE